MRILIDLDDVVDDLLTAWVKELNHKYNLTVQLSDITDWDMTKAFPMLSRQDIFEVLDDELFWKRVVPVDYAIDAIAQLAENHIVYFCTASSPKTFYLKYKYFLKKYFSWFTDLEDHLICIKDKQMIGADILVDDNINNLIDLSDYSADYIGILFTTPHNKNIDLKQYRKWGLYRANNWQEVLNLINEDKIDYFGFRVEQ